jgi:hypothetical protein
MSNSLLLVFRYVYQAFGLAYIAYLSSRVDTNPCNSRIRDQYAAQTRSEEYIKIRTFVGFQYGNDVITEILYR